MEKTMEKIVALAKNRGFVYPGSEIYGGLANTWDYGNLGVELKNNVKRAWWQKFIMESPYNVGVDCAILMNSQTWVASGHLGGFSDPLMDCKDCKTRHRADNLIEDFDGTNVAGWTNEQMMDYIKEKQIPCPDCGSHNFTDIRCTVLLKQLLVQSFCFFVIYAQIFFIHNVLNDQVLLYLGLRILSAVFLIFFFCNSL